MTVQVRDDAELFVIVDRLRDSVPAWSPFQSTNIQAAVGIEIFSGVGEDGSVSHLGDHPDPLSQQ